MRTHFSPFSRLPLHSGGWVVVVYVILAGLLMFFPHQGKLIGHYSNVNIYSSSRVNDSTPRDMDQEYIFPFLQVPGVVTEAN